jgi:hypothetical protein
MKPKSTLILILFWFQTNAFATFNPSDTLKTNLSDFYQRPTSYSFNLSAFNDSVGSVVIQSKSWLWNQVNYTPVKYMSLGIGTNRFVNNSTAYFFLKPSLPISKNIAIGGMVVGYFDQVFIDNKSTRKFKTKILPQLTFRTKYLEYSASYVNPSTLIHSLRLNTTRREWLGFETFGDQTIYPMAITYNLNRSRFDWGFGLQFYKQEDVLPFPVFNCRYTF